MPPITRRDFLRAAGLGAATAAVGVMAVACAPSAPPAATTPATPRPAGPTPSARLQLPTYAPPRKPTPDVPGTDLIPDGYASYPKTQVQSVPSAPGKGGDVTVVGVANTPLTQLENNSLWQQLNKALNVNLKLNLFPSADYNSVKFQTTIAGGDLPDMLWAPPGGVIPELPTFLESKMQDLTPFVGGDAIKEWPNLAGLPTAGWRGQIYNGKIFAVPLVRSPFYWGLWGHQELLEEANLGWPKSADEFKQTLAALTHADRTQWGIGTEAGPRYAFGLTNVYGSLWPAIMGAPNNWGATSDGKFTKDFESEQFKAAVGLVRDLVAAGSFDPMNNYTSPTATAALYARRIAFRFELAIDPFAYDSGTDLPDASSHFTPPAKVRLAPPIPAVAGGKAQYNFGIGSAGFVLLKKASTERIKELLGILNYIAAPFGSQEDLIVNYGVKGSDFNFDDSGNPVPTKQGQTNIINWNGALILPSPVLYNSYNRDYAAGMNASLRPLEAVGVNDPTVGLYSTTNQSKGMLIQQKFAEAMIEIVVGREQLTSFDQALKDWRTNGGDQIRDEFQRAYAEAK